MEATDFLASCGSAMALVQDETIWWFFKITKSAPAGWTDELQPYSAGV